MSPKTVRSTGRTATIRRRGLTRGLIGGQRGWSVLGGVFWAAHLLRRAGRRTEQTVALERLMPGQTMTLTAVAPAGRRERRLARRAARG